MNGVHQVQPIELEAYIVKDTGRHEFLRGLIEIIRSVNLAFFYSDNGEELIGGVLRCAVKPDRLRLQQLLCANRVSKKQGQDRDRCPDEMAMHSTARVAKPDRNTKITCATR